MQSPPTYLNQPEHVHLVSPLFYGAVALAVLLAAAVVAIVLLVRANRRARKAVEAGGGKIEKPMGPSLTQMRTAAREGAKEGMAETAELLKPASLQELERLTAEGEEKDRVIGHHQAAVSDLHALAQRGAEIVAKLRNDLVGGKSELLDPPIPVVTAAAAPVDGPMCLPSDGPVSNISDEQSVIPS